MQNYNDMNQKPCNLCNALHPLDAKECTHCSGNFEKKNLNMLLMNLIILVRKK